MRVRRGCGRWLVICDQCDPMPARRGYGFIVAHARAWWHAMTIANAHAESHGKEAA